MPKEDEDYEEQSMREAEEQHEASVRGYEDRDTDQ